MGVSAATRTLRLTIAIDREDDGRWIAEIPEIAGVIVYGESEGAAITAVKGLALNVLGERLTRGEDPLTGHPKRPIAETGFERIEFEAALAV